MHNPSTLQSKRLGLELFHVQTNTSFALPQKFTVIRIGKPKEQFIPDIDVSYLPNADFVSRRHSEIHAEKSGYYIVDMGSANGTYVNNISLKPQERYPLNLGDMIDLGNGSRMTFLFQYKQEKIVSYDTKLNNPPTVIQIELVVDTKPTLLERFRKLVRLIRKKVNHIFRFFKKL